MWTSIFNFLIFCGLLSDHAKSVKQNLKIQQGKDKYYFLIFRWYFLCVLRFSVFNETMKAEILNRHFSLSE